MNQSQPRPQTLLSNFKIAPSPAPHPNERECQCGSGQHWVSCGEASPNCG